MPLPRSSTRGIPWDPKLPARGVSATFEPAAGKAPEKTVKGSRA